MFFDLPQLVRDFCTEKIIKTNKKKEWSSSEQVPNETVAKNSWRYLFANPDRYIYIYIYIYIDQ